MPDFTCTDCGVSFSLPDHVVSRYPGWTPRQCRACRDVAGSDGGGQGAGRPNGRGAGQGAGQGVVRSPGQGARRGNRGRAVSLVEENLTLAEVLEKYDGGPQDGVFTDGSAVPNPGPGGWGAVYVVDGQVVDQAHGHEPQTTNNRMELTALLHGFDLVPAGAPAVVYTDSRLAVDTITKWAAGWERRGWKRKTGEIANLDLVKALYAKARARPELRLSWIAAHAGARWNEYADSLATAWMRSQL